MTQRWRITVAVGTLLLVAGIVMTPLPGPGIVIAVLGLIVVVVGLATRPR